uniref:Rhodanese domain-containing protein n=1 Tax=Cuerna arida TaxID=1464854 RepID=A0A1B6G2F7_9HEMI
MNITCNRVNHWMSGLLKASRTISTSHIPIYDHILSSMTASNLKTSNNLHTQLISYKNNLDKINFSSLIRYTSRYLSSNMSSVNEEFRHLDFDQLNEARQKQDTVLIDVREKEELAQTGTIPGAHHIPVGEMAKALATPDEEFKKMYKFPKPAQDSNVIFSCRSGKRSLAALEVALANGYSNARHYKGGFLDWEKNTSGTN